MILSRNCLSNALLLAIFGSLFCLSGCAGVNAARMDSLSVPTGPSIAVFPIENLSGTAVPLRAVRDLLVRELRAKGFSILDEETLEKFMVRNRVRYASGIDDVTARALRNETGAGAVIITSIELYSDIAPPRIALSSRLVSTEDTPAILWADGVGLAGDDSPGILGLGLIEDHGVLLKKALETLVSSLGRHYQGEADNVRAEKLKRKFDPKIAYRSPALDMGKRKYTVAVIPVFNLSDRKDGGEVMVLHFIRNLKKFENFDVVEPGLVRKAFLTLRMIMEEGVSLQDAGVLFAALNVDMILSCRVLDYQDTQAGYGKPKVNFSVQLIDKNTRKIVWSSISRNEGDDGVFFFDWGRVNTAHAMASQMVMAVGKAMESR